MSKPSTPRLFDQNSYLDRSGDFSGFTYNQDVTMVNLNNDEFSHSIKNLGRNQSFRSAKHKMQASPKPGQTRGMTPKMIAEEDEEE